MKRAVTKALERRDHQMAGRLRTGRYTAWWYLTLECGHSAHRPMRYEPPNPRGGRRCSKAERALPAPKRVECARCNESALPKSARRPPSAHSADHGSADT